MAIRLRLSNFRWVALCAAKSKAKKGDLYLDDGMHGALSDKFTKDFGEMGFLKKNFLLQWRLDNGLLYDEAYVSEKLH